MPWWIGVVAGGLLIILPPLILAWLMATTPSVGGER